MTGPQSTHTMGTRLRCIYFSLLCCFCTVSLASFVDHFGDANLLAVSEIRTGIQLAFSELNTDQAVACVSGRDPLLTLRTLNVDSASSIEQVVGQVDWSTSVGMLGIVGDPFAEMALNISNIYGIPCIAPSSGHTRFRMPFSPLVVNLRASQADEILGLVRHLRFVRTVQLISVVYERTFIDDYALNVLFQAINRTGVAVLSSSPVVNSDITQTLDLLRADAQPFIAEALAIFASASLAAEVIRTDRLQSASSSYQLYAVTWTDDLGILENGLRNNSSNVVMAQVLPPLDSDYVYVQKFRFAFGAAFPSVQPTLMILEGYLSGLSFGHLYREMGCQAIDLAALSYKTRSSRWVFDIFGFEIGPFVNASCNQGMKEVWVVEGAANGAFRMVGHTAGLGQACFSDFSVIEPPPIVFFQVAQLSFADDTADLHAEGILAAFDEKNRQGGVRNHLLQLERLFSGATDNDFIFMHQKLLGRSAKFFIGSIGSADSLNSVANKALTSKTAIFAPYSGASSLRLSSPYVLNVRASFRDEINALINFATATLNLVRISIVFQDDAFGREGLTAALEAMDSINLKLLSNGTFALNKNSNIEAALNNIVGDAQPFVPEAIVVWAIGDPAVRFIRAANAILPNSTVFLCGSLVGAAFAFNFTANDVNLFVSQAFPLATDLSNNLVRSYQSAMQARDPNFKPSMVSFEGYVSARFAIESLELAAKTNLNLLDPSDVVAAVYRSSTILVDNFMIGPYTDGCNQGMKKVWVSRVVNGEYVSVPEATFAFDNDGTCMSTNSSLRTKYLLFGQSSAFSGPSGLNGPALRSGILAAFAQANLVGCSSNYRLRLMSLDDGYTVPLAVQNTNHLIRQKVYGLIGYYGTSISRAVSPIAESNRLPYVAPYTGAASLRQFTPYIVNVRASYRDEINAAINFVTTRLNLVKISIIYQDDAFGKEGLDALLIALDSINLKLLSNATYPPNTLDVQPGLNAIIANAQPFVPEAVVVWAVGAPATAIIQAAQAKLPSSTVYLCGSIVGEGFVTNFRQNYSNIYVSQVFPLAWDVSYDVVRSYQTAMRGRDPSFQPSMVSLEGYINARIVIEVLERIKNLQELLNQSTMVEALYNHSVFAIDRLVIGPYTQGCNQGMKKVWLSRIVSGEYVSMPEETFSFAEGSCISDGKSLQTNFILFGQSCVFSGPSALNGPAFRSGILAAFAEGNSDGEFGSYRFGLLSLDDSYTVAGAVPNTLALLRMGVFALIGYFGTSISNAVAPLADAASTPFISPGTGTLTMRNPNLNVINIRASYYDEMNAILHFLLSQYGATRISLFYQADPFGEQGLLSLQTALSVVNLTILSTGTYPVNDVNVRDGLTAIVQGAGKRKIQAVVLWAVGTMAAKFIELAKRELDGSVVYGCPSVVGEGFMELLGNNTDNVFVSQVLPPMGDVAHPLVARYHTAMTLIDPSFTPSMFSFEAYANARISLTILKRNSLSHIRDREAFMDSVYAESVITVDSVYVGPFVRGQCNQGIHQVWMSRIENRTYVSVPRFSFTFPQMCLSDPAVTLHRPILFGFVYEIGTTFAAFHRQGLIAAFHEMNQNGGIGGRTCHLVELGYDEGQAPTQIATLFETFLTDNENMLAVLASGRDYHILGALAKLCSESARLLFSVRGRVGGEMALPRDLYHIFLGFSYMDEAYAVVRYFTRYGVRRFGVWHQSDATAEIAEIRTAWGMVAGEFKTDVSVLADGSFDGMKMLLNNQLGSPFQAVVISQAQDVAMAFQATRKSFPSIPIVVLTAENDVLSLQQELRIQLGFGDVYAVLPVPFSFSSNDDLSAHCTAALSRDNVAPPYSPSHVEGCILAKMLMQIVSFAQTDPMAQAFYSTSFFTVNGLRLGPFVNASCHLKQATVKDCECDQGLHQVALVKLSINETIFLQPIPDSTYVFDTCGTIIIPAAVSSTSVNQIVGFTLAGFFLVAVIVGGFLVYAFMSKRRRRIAALKAAPNGTVTIVFTDVQDSTKLWDICPGMHDALVTHNDTMRRLIQGHGGYEVKTQGDSFMVAFSDVATAVLWSLEVQEQLLLDQWPTDILAQDSARESFSHATEGGDDDDGETGGAGPSTSEPETLPIFRGLRVRVGMHTGCPEREYNPRTGSVDYFGPVVNCAARIEALGAGGQVLMSIESYKMVAQSGGIPDLDVQYLGKYPLKGMMTHQEIVQVSRGRLRLRRFPPINPLHLSTSSPCMTSHDVQLCESCSRPLRCTHCFSTTSEIRKTSMSPSVVTRISHKKATDRMSVTSETTTHAFSPPPPSAPPKATASFWFASARNNGSTETPMAHDFESMLRLGNVDSGTDGGP